MRIKKWLRRTCAFLAISLTLLVGGVFVATTVFEDDLKALALEQLEHYLVTRMQLSTMDVTLWEHFPQASVRLNDVLIETPDGSGDTLITANELFLEFDLWQLTRGNYQLEAIHLENGRADFERDHEGRENFRFWRTDSTTENTGTFELQLDRIALNQFTFCYTDFRSDTHLSTYIQHGTYSGRFRTGRFEIDAESKGVMHQLTVGPTSYFNGQELDLDVTLSVDMTADEYAFEEGKFVVDGIPILAGGTVILKDRSTALNLAFSGDDVSLDRAVNNTPDRWKPLLARYEPSGIFDFNGQVSGTVSPNTEPALTVDYVLSNGRFRHNASALAFSSIESSGTYRRNSDGSDQLIVNNCSADFEDGVVQVNGSLANLQQPQANLRLRGNLNLEDVRRFTESETLEILDGGLELDATWKGPLPTGNSFTAATWESCDIQGTANITNGRFKLKQAPKACESLNGTVRLEGMNIHVDQLYGRLAGSDFEVTGDIRQLLPYALDGQSPLSIRANISSSGIDLDALLASNSDETGAYWLELPANVSCSLDMDIGRLEFREFTAQAVQGKVQLAQQQLHIDPLSLETADGSFEASLTIDGRPSDELVLYSRSRLEGIDVQALFKQFEDFGQDFLTARHVKGTASATADFRATLGKDLRFDPDQIKSTVDVVLTNGELIGLQSMEHIADYVSNNLMAAQLVNESALRRKLEHITFETLENEIEIRDGTITIPRMEIRSSAMDIAASGSHRFDNHIDYSLAFQVRDILSKSADSEFGTVADDGLSNRFFLKMTGTTDDPQFAYDRMAHKEQRKEDRKTSRAEARDALRSTFSRKGSKPTAEPNSTDEIQISVAPDVPSTASDQGTNAEAVSNPSAAKKRSWKERLLGEAENSERKIEVEPEEELEDDDF